MANGIQATQLGTAQVFIVAVMPLYEEAITNFRCQAEE